MATDALAPCGHGIQYVIVSGHFCLSEFQLYWRIRVLDSVKCSGFSTNYKAFLAT